MSASNYFCVYVFPYSVFMTICQTQTFKRPSCRRKYASFTFRNYASCFFRFIFTACYFYGCCSLRWCQRCISLEMSPVCLLHTCTADPNQTLSATPTSTITSNLPKCRETLYRTPHSQFLKRKAAEAWERTNPLTEAYQAQSTNAISADLESLRPLKDEHVHAFPSLSFN